MLIGVEFVDEGSVTSINDNITEVTLSWIARDIRPLSLRSGGVRTELEFTENLAAALLNDTASNFNEYSYYNGLVLHRQNQVDTANHRTARNHLDSGIMPATYVRPFGFGGQ